MKVIRHHRGEAHTTYTIRKANGNQFTASYSKRYCTFAWDGAANANEVIDAVWIYQMKQSAWWSVPLLSVIVVIVLIIGNHP